TAPFLGLPEMGRVVHLGTAVRNGFSTAATDAGNKDSRFADWPLKQGASEIDWDLTRNWSHHSTHEMTVVGKAVSEALYGDAPKFSYIVGASGGGRQALMEAQRYPQDYDGAWASDPAINYTKFVPAGLWAPLVMKESGVVLAYEKLDAFRAAAIEACDGLDGLKDGIIGAFDPCDYDPRQPSGNGPAAGPITAADAEVIAKIWEGPRKRNGDFLWYGLHPGTNSWFPAGFCSSAEIDGKRVPIPFIFGPSYFRTWVLKD